MALFSLIEPLDTDVSQLATVIDEVLKDSLWKERSRGRTNPHGNSNAKLLRSRAEWLWRGSTAEQRFFFSARRSRPEMIPINCTAPRASSFDRVGKNGRPCPVPVLLRSALTAHPAS